MGSRTKKELMRQKIYDTEEYIYYSSRIKLLSTNMFKWGGLDDWNIPEEYIEEKLYTLGKLAFYYDDKYGLVCLPYSNQGKKTMYGENTKIELNGGDYRKIVNREDVVILRNNKMCLPTSHLVRPLIRKLCDVSRTTDTNIYLQRLSKIIMVDEKQRLTVENLLAQYEGNVPLILTDKYFKNVIETSKDKTLDLSVEFKALQLLDVENRLWRKLLETIGINSANTEKRERLLTDEVNSNNELNETATDIFLSPREHATILATKKWSDKGVNLNVERRNKIEYNNNSKEIIE